MPDIVFEDKWTRIICGDVLEVLSKADLVPISSVQMAMTSVPYLRQRRYSEQAWGWEESVEEWLEKMYLMAKAVSLALKPDGTFWFNCGDKWGGSHAGSDYGDKRSMEAPDDYSKLAKSKLAESKINRKGNLMQLPERVSIRLTDERVFTLINKVIWWKRNRAVQSYQRKFVDTWEPVYFFAKHADKYKFNRSKVGVQQRGGMEILSLAEEEEETEFAQQTTLSYEEEELWHPQYDADHPPPFGTPEYREWYENTRNKQAWHDHKDDDKQGQRFGRKQGSYGKAGHAKGQGGSKEAQSTQVLKHPDGSNPGDVWDISVKTDPFFARSGMPARMWPAWPLDLCTIPLLATTDENDIVLDPFAGSGSLGVAAKQLGRKSILIDVDRESCRIAAVRIMKAQPLLQASQRSLI